MHKIIRIILIPNPYPITFILHMNKFMVSVEYQVIVRNKFFFDIIEFMKNEYSKNTEYQYHIEIS